MKYSKGNEVIMELWNEICFLVNQYRKPNYSERDFRIKVEHIFEKLGLSIRSAQSLKSDIIISQSGRRLFVTDLKKPNAELISRNIDQLISYMLQLRFRFGLLIGDSLHVYYDVPEDNKIPVKVIEIPFVSDDVNGAELVSLLQKNSISDERLTSWCLKKIKERLMYEQANNLIGSLTSPNGQKLINNVLKNHLSAEYPQDVVSKVLNIISVQIVLEQQAPSTTLYNRSIPQTPVYASGETIAEEKIR